MTEATEHAHTQELLLNTKGTEVILPARPGLTYTCLIPTPGISYYIQELLFSFLSNGK